MDAVAEMLNLTGRSTEMAVLDRLDQMDPEVAEEIRNRMFTFNDIVDLSDREIGILLREIDQGDLVIALKGANEEMAERIFANVSNHVAKTIQEEMQFTGHFGKAR